MVTLVTQYFEFNTTSLEYGQFLVTCYENYPEIVIINGQDFYHVCDYDNEIYTVDVPGPLAVILKLRFGNCLRERLVYKEDEDDSDSNY